MIRLHNTLTRSIDEFSPLKNGLVTMYSCGPTVYDYPHIGNWSSYIRWDTLARVLRHQYKLEWYMNITDVGHLVSDADEGEDKLEKGAKREGKTAWQIAEFYTANFIESLDTLNISIDRSHLVKATDHIQEQISLIRVLEEKGYTYVIDDGVYFDSTKYADYGKMARLDLEGLKAGARVDVGQKKHPSDFALWKFSPAATSRDMEWDSPWGKGFPGWHIECSAMSMKYLGETIDIHTGGIDHIPIHHTNEIAQSEAATGKQFVRFWLHNNFLQVDGTKISKSLNNFLTLKDINDKGYTAVDFRLFVLQSHYQTESNFTWESMDAAKLRLSEIKAFADLRFQAIRNQNSQINFEDYKNKIFNALNTNLNTPQALAYISEVINEAEGTGLPDNGQAFGDFLVFLDDSLGLNLLSSEDISEEVRHLINARDEARERKDWNEADRIRDGLDKQGIVLNDTNYGTTWRRR